MTDRISFADLVDWVEGRSTPARAASIERAVVADPDLAESVSWIRGFLRDAAAMPLHKPPAELSARLHALFGDAQPSDTDGWSEATLMHDSRRMTIAGVRSTVTAESAYLAYESEVGRFVVEISRAGAGTVDLQGLVLTSPAGGVELTFLKHGVLRRAARTGLDGRFEIPAVPDDVDELRISAGSAQVCARLDLSLD